MAINLVRQWLDQILACVFLVSLFILSSVRHAPLFITTASTTTGKAILLVTVLLTLSVIVRPNQQSTTYSIKSCIFEFTPLILALLAYENLKYQHASALTVWLGIMPKDALMLSIDRFLFGTTPSLWFEDLRRTSHTFTIVMTVIYGLYYSIPAAAMGWFWLDKNIEQVRLIRRGLIIAFYGGYCSYVLIPVSGPKVLPLDIRPLFYNQMTDFHFLMENFRYGFDCFPSLHTAIPWLVVILCFAKWPKWLVILAILISVAVTISTVALGFHYGIDLIAGLAWAWISARLARLTFAVELYANPDLTSRPLLK